MNIGFIGCGNMGKAMVSGIIKNDLVPARNIFASVKTEGSLISLKESFGINAFTENSAVSRVSDILILAVKPGLFGDVIEGIRNHIKDDALIISIAAGQTTERITEFFKKDIRLIRAMPNTPALIGKGMTGYCCKDNVSAEDKALAGRILSCFGTAINVPESMMDLVTAVSGSSPAYIYMVIEAMMDFAVSKGMDPEEARTFVCTSVTGAAAMVSETGETPLKLRQNVCSPGGTTIEAVNVFTERDLQGIIKEGMEACLEKSKKM